MITPETALEALRAGADPAEAARATAYHKTTREVLGLRVPAITALAQEWRQELDLAGRVALADALWQSNIHEARVAAAKLLLQARIPNDGPVWALITSWVPEFDGWALADHASDAGSRRLIADPSRLDEVESWTGSENLWSRRAALVMTLPWAKMPFPKAADLAARERILGWAANAISDRDWFMQKAIAWWIRDLSKHDAARARAFLDQHGAALKSFARKEAARHLPASDPAP